MPQINVTVDVYCTQPDWVFEERLKADKYYEAVYRLYANHDLLTERTWAWGKKPLSENIWLEGDREKYSIKLVPILKNPAMAKFKLHNLIVKNANYNITEAGVYAITFTLS